jgi:nitrile hydratase
MHDHDHADNHHDGEHRHPHDPQRDEPLGHYQIMGLALQELMIDKGIVTAEDIRRSIEAMDARTPAAGAQVVARAWTDPAFKERLLADGSKTVRELGIEPAGLHLVVVENTPAKHNVIVCTLCSCYPRMILGPPPSWYKTREYRSRVVREPRQVLEEFGTELADASLVQVHDSTADIRYLVLPMRPDGTDGLSEQQLADLVTRDCMIGVSLPKLAKLE